MTGSNNDIKIQTIRWELDTGNLATAHRWQDIASRFSQQELVPLMESLIAPFNEEDRLLRLDRIELDLSNINSEEELEERFRVLFSERIASWPKGKNEYGAESTGVAEVKADRLEMFRQYLFTGVLQWNMRIMEEDAAHLFETLDDLEVDELKEWLQPVVASHHSLLRFLEFFTGEQSRSLLLKIHPVDRVQEKIRIIERILEATGVERSSYTLFYSLYQHLSTVAGAGESSFFIKWWNDARYMGYVKDEDIRQAESVINESGRTIDVELERMFSLLREEGIPVTEEGGPGNETVELTNDIHLEVFFKDDERKTFIENAGIVLLYPYLKRWFSDHHLLEEGKDFIDPRRQLEACYLLQFIATGDPDVKEYELFLNKILCGFPADAPVSRYWNPEKADPLIADECIRQVISDWPALGKTSPPGFRGSFLLRPGKLVEEDLNWLLIVERKAWDMLLEKISYPISIIRLPWMIKPLYVQW